MKKKLGLRLESAQKYRSDSDSFFAYMVDIAIEDAV